MTHVLVFLIVIAVSLLAYVYSGYPIALRLLVRMRGARPIRRADIAPDVTLVVSAYNEAAVIGRKLENALALDYPGSLEIVVISDASTDETDSIVARYADRGVRLVRQPSRRGKTAGLNRALPQVRGEIVVFSDANAIYERDALRNLVRSFADPDVGCVVGEARYVPGGRAAADVGERVYWGYEMQIKRLETAVGSMVGGDGAIYAIRRLLWRELPEDAINDFLNPLQIVAAGWRVIYEPEAVCYEEPAGTVSSEYRRRVRIVSRSWRAVFLVPAVLNPFRVGLFAWSLISHKLLRWLSGPILVVGGVATVILAGNVADQTSLAMLAAVALALSLVLVSSAARRVLGMLGYYVVINVASSVGVMKGTFGRVSGIWVTPRERASIRVPRVMVPVGRLTIALMVGAVVFVAAVWLGTGAFPTRPLFWSAGLLFVYVYVGYPAILAMLRLVARTPVRVASIEPEVCLFITANDEEAVIEAKLRNALELDYPPDRLSIVVASDGSVDGTNEIVRRFAPQVHLLEFSPRRGKIAAITRGMREVTSEIVVFSDANTFLERGAIRALVRNFADESVGAVSGDVALTGLRASLGRSEDLYYRYERWIQRAESEMSSMIGADGALYAIRRELFVAPLADTILDDMAIPMSVLRTGHRVVFEGAARAFEEGSATAREEFSRKVRVIAGAVQFLARRDSDVPVASAQAVLSVISHKALRWLSPMFAMTAVLTSLALAGTAPPYAVAGIGQLLLLAVGLAGCAPALRRSSFVSLAHYFCLVQAAAAVGFARGVCGRQSVLWRRFNRMPVRGPVGMNP